MSEIGEGRKRRKNGKKWFDSHNVFLSDYWFLRLSEDAKIIKMCCF